MEKFQEYLDMIFKLIVEYSPKVIYALILLVVGLFIIKLLTKATKKVMRKQRVEETLVKFLSNLFNWALKALLFVAVIAYAL